MADWAAMDEAARGREIARRVAAGESLAVIAADLGVSMQAVRLRAPEAAVAPVTPEAAKRMVEGVGAALRGEAVDAVSEAGAQAEERDDVARIVADLNAAWAKRPAPAEPFSVAAKAAETVDFMTRQMEAEAAVAMVEAVVAPPLADDGGTPPESLPAPRRSGPAPTPEAELAALVALWAEGLSYEAIGARLGIDRGLVGWRLKLAAERGIRTAEMAERRKAALVAAGERRRFRSAEDAVDARMAEVVRRVNAGETDAAIEAATGIDLEGIRSAIDSALRRHIPIARRTASRPVTDHSGHPAVALMREGLSNRDIAERLGMTPGQIAGLRDRAVRKGLVDPGPRVTHRPAPSLPAAPAAAAKGLSEAEIAAVAEAWNGGKTYDEIGAALGLTSNQVQYRVSAARRAGMILRAAWPASAGRGPAPVQARARPAVVAKPAPPPRALAEITPVVPVALEADGPPEPGRYTVLDRMGGRCRWVSDVLAAPGRHGLTHMMCGERVDRPGSSWCPEHHRLAWRRVPLPSERAAKKFDGRVA